MRHEHLYSGDLKLTAAELDRLGRALVRSDPALGATLPSYLADIEKEIRDNVAACCFAGPARAESTDMVFGLPEIDQSMLLAPVSKPLPPSTPSLADAVAARLSFILKSGSRPPTMLKPK